MSVRTGHSGTEDTSHHTVDSDDREKLLPASGDMAGPMVPVMTAAELALLKTTLSRCCSYLEFGTGGSTLLALECPPSRIVSVDSNHDWIHRIRGHSGVREAEVEGRLILHHAEIGATGDWGLPIEPGRMPDWPRYYSTVWSRSPVDYDVVLVDGRFRVACALMTALCIPHDFTLLIHDYETRPYYRTVETHFDRVEAVDSLVAFQRSRELDVRALTLDLLSAVLDPR